MVPRGHGQSTDSVYYMHLEEQAQSTVAAPKRSRIRAVSELRRLTATLCRTEERERGQQAVSLCLFVFFPKESLRTFLGSPKTYPSICLFVDEGLRQNVLPSRAAIPQPWPAPRSSLHSLLLHQHHLPIRPRMWRSGCPELLSPPSACPEQSSDCTFPDTQRDPLIFSMLHFQSTLLTRIDLSSTPL